MVLAVNGRDEPAAKVRKFVREKNLTHRVLLTGQSVAKETYGNRNIPETFLIDRSGKVVWGHLGFEKTDAALLAREIEKAL